MTGVLLVNLGSPTSFEKKDVRVFLKAFLMDSNVLELPWLLRFLIVYGVVLPFRTRRTCAAYQKIWTHAGSPLRVYTNEVQKKLQAQLGSEFLIKWSMQYGKPTLEEALKNFSVENCFKKIIIFPLYPQYSQATTEASKEKFYKLIRKIKDLPEYRWIDPFYKREEYLNAVTETTLGFLQQIKIDHVLFSFHGMPLKHKIYYDQCLETAKLLAHKMNFTQNHSISFQSRFGKTKWLEPYTEKLLKELPQKGVKNLAVVCPSFVTDCLETLEEVQIRGKEIFLKSGGQNLYLVPSLNSTQTWIEAISRIIKSV